MQHINGDICAFPKNFQRPPQILHEKAECKICTCTISRLVIRISSGVCRVRANKPLFTKLPHPAIFHPRLFLGIFGTHVIDYDPNIIENRSSGQVNLGTK